MRTNGRLQQIFGVYTDVDIVLVCVRLSAARSTHTEPWRDMMWNRETVLCTVQTAACRTHQAHSVWGHIVGADFDTP